jgi:hypothetical protein
MWRYLKAAFWVPLRIPALGDLPINVLALAGFFILGLGELIRFGHAAFWLLGLGLEVGFLFALATSRRFQNWVQAEELSRVNSAAEDKRDTLIGKLSPESRRRLYTLEEKIARIHQIHQDNQSDTLIVSGNREALQRLAWMYLKLLLGEQNLLEAGDTDTEKRVKRQLEQLENELRGTDLSAQARESKQATLGILQKRLENFTRRRQLLKETHSDLARIDAQVELALENAMMRGAPQIISENIELAGALLQDGYYGELESVIVDLDREYG